MCEFVCRTLLVKKHDARDPAEKDCLLALKSENRCAAMPGECSQNTLRYPLGCFHHGVTDSPVLLFLRASGATWHSLNTVAYNSLPFTPATIRKVELKCVEKRAPKAPCSSSGPRISMKSCLAALHVQAEQRADHVRLHVVFARVVFKEASCRRILFSSRLASGNCSKVFAHLCMGVLRIVWGRGVGLAAQSFAVEPLARSEVHVLRKALDAATGLISAHTVLSPPSSILKERLRSRKALYPEPGLMAASTFLV